MVEMVGSIVLVGVGLVAALNTVGASKMSQFRVIASRQGHLLALQLMTEILEQEYEEPVDTVVFGRESSESAGDRADWDDVDDYDGWDSTPPEYKDGTAMSDLGAWRRIVQVDFVSPSDPTVVVGTDQGIKRITVSVKQNGIPAAELVALKTIGLPPLEACCLGDGSCEDLRVEACAGQGGTAKGPKTHCATIDCRPSPILHYDFDEQTGTTVTDREGNVDLTIYPGNGAITWVDDGGGTGLFFDQNGETGTAVARTVDDNVADTLKSALQATNQLTVQVYLYAEEFDGLYGRTITYSRDTGSSTRNFTIAADHVAATTSYMFGRVKLSSSASEYVRPDIIPMGNRTVLAFSVDATITSNNIKHYVDGQLVKTSSGTGDFSQWTSERLLLGNGRTLDRPMRGTFYDVKIWDVAMSGVDLQEAALMLLGRVCGDATCDTGEACSCAADCGTPAAFEQPGVDCADSLDNDCDGATDCDDSDCAADWACLFALCNSNGVCDSGEDCSACGTDCDSKTNGPQSGRYCCGNGIAESAEGDGSICDGNY